MSAFKRKRTDSSKKVRKPKIVSQESRIKVEIEHALSNIKSTFLNKNFDTINEIVEILIGP
jgi:hypothetical protein